jgi:acetate kinase
VNVLTVNGGSSTIKCAIFRREAGGPPERVMRSVVEGDDVASLLNSLEQHSEFAAVGAVGHRVVHGMQRFEPELISPELLTALRALCPFVPEHLPAEIALIEAVRARHPKWPQVACFDTAFHHGMPRIAKLIAVPRRFEAKGVERYGFHGLSYEFLMGELARTDSAGGRVILAHLGAGASLAAVRDGKSVDTSMGFTPASGLVMGTRAGDVDPGLVAFLAREESMTPDRFERMTSHESGLLGVSETSADMRDLLKREANDVRAAEAIALFCYQARKWIGAFAAALDGLDTLVFAGGIGENAPVVRARICEGLGFLGVELDAAANAAGSGVISTHASRVSVRVIRTDEELMIARCVYRMLGESA